MTVARTDRNEGSAWPSARLAVPSRTAGAGERFRLAQDRPETARADARIAAARQDRARAETRQAEAGREARRAEEANRAAVDAAAAKRAPPGKASVFEAAAPRSEAADASKDTTKGAPRDAAPRPAGGAKAQEDTKGAGPADPEGEAASAQDRAARAATGATGKGATGERATGEGAAGERAAQEDEAAAADRAPEGVAGPVPMPVPSPMAASAGPAVEGQPGAAVSAEQAGAQVSQAVATVPAGEDTASLEAAQGEPSKGDPLGGGAKAFEAALAAAGGGSDAGPAPAASPSSLSQSTAAPGGLSATVESAPKTESTPALPAPIPLGAVPMTIGLRTLAGAARFAIRLDPVELGAIEVSLDLDREAGRARAHLTVDRPETLALLQRDAGALQQALAQAGFETSEGIGLSLRGEPGGQDGQGSGREPDRGGAPGTQASAATGREAETVLDPSALRRLRAVGGLDLRI